jgi:hypothetical protein
MPPPDYLKESYMVAVAEVQDLVELKVMNTWTAEGIERLSTCLQAFEKDSAPPILVRAVDAVMVGGKPVPANTVATLGLRPPHGQRFRSSVRFVAGDSTIGPMLYAAQTDARIAAMEGTLATMAEHLAAPVAGAKRGKGGRNGKLYGKEDTVDERVKKLHEKAPEMAEEPSLRELGKLLRCSPSAFIGGDYYENTLKGKREEVRAAKSMKRASGPDWGRDANRQVVRDNRDHVESYEDVDDHIDATWDERQGGRFAN